MDNQIIQYNKEQKRDNRNWHCIKQMVRKDYITRAFGCQAPNCNNGSLAIDCLETWLMGDKRRRWMDREGEGNNGYRKRVSLI